jgi:hypothetical protein
MPDTPEFLSDRLVNEGEKSIEFFRHLSPASWQKEIYTDGAVWTLHEVLAHFVATETSLCKLVENIAAGGTGSPIDFDINLYNNRKVIELKEETVPDLLEQFWVNRLRTAEIVRKLQTGNLELMGRHPFLGIAPLSEIIKIIYRHNQIHQREIRSTLTKDE